MSLVNMFGNKIPAAGGGAWTPADLFTGGKDGFWWDFSDLSVLFQDTAGLTPVTTNGQNCLRVNDKSGNGYDGTGTGTTWDSGGSFLLDSDTDQFTVSTPSEFTTDMDCHLGVMRASGDGNSAMVRNNSNPYFALMQSGSSSRPDAASGTPTYIVDGTLVSPTERGALNTALTETVNHNLECNNIDMLTGDWTGVTVGAYIAGFDLQGNVYQVVLVEGLSAGDITLLRDYIDTKLGI